MKKGIRAQFSLKNIILGALLIFFILAIGLTMSSGNGLSGWSDAVNQAAKIFMDVFQPLFNNLLDLSGNNASNSFLAVLAFFLIALIIISTLDSVEIFGDGTQAKIVNFFVGIIVSIIGVRYMPSDIWSSLTAPSSAFVAAMLLLIPLIAIFFISMKSKWMIFSKLLWIFYIVLTVYLLFNLAENSSIRWVYVVALLLAAVMLIFDSTIRHLIFQEKHKLEIEDTIGQMNAQQRYHLRRQIEKWQEIIADTTASKSEIALAKNQLMKASKRYGDISAV